MNPRLRRLWVVSVVGLPAVLLAPVLTIPLPAFYRAVEAAGYYQTAALYNDGIRSFTYLSLAESSAGLHLHALSSVPLFAVGVFEAGRVVSLVSAVAAAALLAWTVTRLFDRRTAAVAVAATWLHPLFRRLATAWMPEMLGIALTLAVLATAIQWRETDERTWAWLSALLLVVAIQNHAWEAVVLLPVTGIALRKGDFRVALGYLLAAGLGVAVLFGVRSLQPQSTTLIADYAVFYHPRALFTPEWLFWRRFSLGSLYRAVMTLTVPLTLVAIACVAGRWLHRRRPNSEVLGLWLLSGLAPLVLLPRGYVPHSYYAWGTIAPLCTVGAVALHHLVTRRRVRRLSPNAGAVLPLFVTLLLLSAFVPAVGVQERSLARAPAYPVDGGHVRTAGHPLVDAGRELRTRGVSNLSALAFVGPWGGSTNPDHTRTLQNWELPGMVRVVVNAEIFFRQWQLLRGPSSPQLGATVSDIDRRRCEQMVVLNPGNRTVSVVAC